MLELGDKVTRSGSRGVDVFSAAFLFKRKIQMGLLFFMFVARGFRRT